MIAALSVLLLLGLSAFGEAAGADALRTRAAKDLSAANYKFSLDLYKRLVKPGENLITSGISVSTALSMLLSGAGGKTYSELLAVLGYSNLTREDLHSTYPSILTALRGNGSYDLSLANSVWMEKSFRALGEYQQVVRNSYYAELRQLNIPTGKSDINAWVNEKTKGMIPELLNDELSQDTVMMLLNAIFFKGTWEHSFDNRTFESGFLNNDIYIADKPTGTTEMMKTEGSFKYTKSGDLKAYIVDLPYEGGDVSMTILLPYWRLEDLEKNLTASRLQNALNQMRQREVKVVMPVFEIESELDLKDPLQYLGIQEIFSNHANLSNIARDAAIKVSKVIQKAKIDVSVKGTKASAATGVEFELLSAITEFRATRPFLFLIRHRSTNTILFSGRYTQAKPYRKEH